jgi:hypothetical protein
LVVVVLVGSLIAGFVRSVVDLIFGDPNRSPLDRCVTGLARRWENDDGTPIVKPGTDPTPEQKFWAVAYLLAVAAVIGWLFLR